MKGISRRDFLKRSAIAAAGTYASIASGTALGGHMGGGGSGGGGMNSGTTIIDPPVGAAFRDPAAAVDLSTTPGIVEVAVEAKPAQIDVNGTMANLLTYNGQFPAATIRAKRGDMLKVRFKNSLPADGALNMLGHPKYLTNLHTHGLHVSPEGNSDNMLIIKQPGDPEFLYEYDLSKQDSGTLNFYHPHVHGCVADQMWAGMAGSLVIEDDPGLSIANFETHIMMLKDIALSGSDPEPYSTTMDYMHGKEGDVVMVNGQVNPSLNIRPGQVQRWRIVNASTARFYRLSLESHSMYLIGTEGGLVDRPYQLSELIVSPGERVDLLIKAGTKTGTYKFLSLPYDRGMNPLQQVTLLTLSCSGSRVNDALPATVNPNATKLNMDTSMLPVKTITFSMGQGRGYVNGITFTSHESCYTEMSVVGGYEVWELVNESGMDHPFHQHVNPAQVLSITGGDSKYAALYTTIPCWKDVVIMPKWGRVKLLMPVMDFTGMTMFHCHIIEHEDIGMMAMWHLMGDSMSM